MEVAHEPVGDPVPPPSRGAHGGEELDVHQAAESQIGAIIPDAQEQEQEQEQTG